MDRFIDIASKRKVYYAISVCIIIATIILSFTLGVRMDIQFTGGSILTYSYDGEITGDTVEGEIESIIGEPVTLQFTQDIVTDHSNMVISLASVRGMSTDEIWDVTQALNERLPEQNFILVGNTSVDPTLGREFFLKCLVAVAFSSVLTVLFVAFRFKKIGGLSAGCMAVLALIHDLIIIYATFVICRFPLNDNFIAVMLTILGYSVNNTIVVYDRIRENKSILRENTGIEHLVNTSVKQSFSRSITISSAIILSLLVVYIVCLIYNVTSITSFSLPLIMGMLSGLFSSMFIAPSLWVDWQLHKKKKEDLEKQNKSKKKRKK